MRVLLDTNIVLDALLDRAPFAVEASKLLDANKQGHFEAYIAAISPINLFYIGRKIKGGAAIRQDISLILAELRVCAVDQNVLQQALILPFNDYEDGVQYASAIASQMEAIVTRNPKDYTKSDLPIFSPTEFLERLKVEQDK